MSKFLKQTKETVFQDYLEVKYDGIGECSDCHKVTKCVLVNTNEVLCVDSESEKSDTVDEKSCSYKLNWHFQTPKSYIFKSKKLSNTNKFLKQTERTEFHWDSDLDIEDEGTGECSECKKVTTCVLLNTREVLCVDSDSDSDSDNSSCSYKKHTWFYKTPKQYMREMRELREKRAMIENEE